jgi:hypothetical protein
MAIATLSVLGDVESAERYLSWLAALGSSSGMPLQVLYRVDGGADVEEHTRDELAGYRNSRPVRFGNHAYRQIQIDSLGYLADCAAIYVDRGGRLDPGLLAADLPDRRLCRRELAPAEERHLGTGSVASFRVQQGDGMDDAQPRAGHCGAERG